MSRRWRPSLWLVLGGALGGTLALSFAGLVALRYLGPAVGFRHAALGLALVIAGLTGVLGWLLLRLLLRPIAALESYAAEVRAGHPAAPPAHFGTRELHRTARSVIDMAETLRDREATIRSYTDHVTHELRTPVTALRAAVELLEDGGTLSPADRHLLGQIDGARAQIEAQLDALRRAAQAREARHVGSTTLSDLAPLLAAHPLRLEIRGGRVPIPLGAEGLLQVLGQLLRNAAEHGATAITLTAERGEGCTLTVSDDGPGISAGNAGRIFEPFFTTRREEGGTGMGLAIARAILTAHRAGIALVPSARGATFRLDFPAAEG